MARKPYVAKQASNWYMQNTFYKKYMLRELTCLPVILVALNLFWGIGALASSLESWQHWIAFQRHPVSILFNLIALIAALLNTIEWFKAMPKAMRIQVGEKFLDDKKMILGSWAVFATLTLIMLIIVVSMA